MVHRVKDPVLPQLQLQLGFDTWPRNFHILWVWPKNKKKKKSKNKKETMDLRKFSSFSSKSRPIIILKI